LDQESAKRGGDRYLEKLRGKAVRKRDGNTTVLGLKLKTKPS